MFPPIRPRPTMPSCISVPSVGCGDAAPLCSRHSAPQPAGGTLKVLQSHAHYAPVELRKRREVTGRLRADQAPETELATRDRQLVAWVVDHLDEQPGVRPALVELPGRVQVPRAEPVP